MLTIHEGDRDAMEVDQRSDLVQVPEVIQALLSEFSAVTDYRTLRDSLPTTTDGELIEGELPSRYGPDGTNIFKSLYECSASYV